MSLQNELRVLLPKVQISLSLCTFLAILSYRAFKKIMLPLLEINTKQSGNCIALAGKQGVIAPPLFAN